MEKTCDQYSFEDINLFVDNELTQNKHIEIARHCESCQRCSRLVAEITSIGSVFNNYVEQHSSGVHPDIIPDMIKKTLNQKPTASKKTLSGNVFGHAFGLFGKHIYLKLSGIAAILIIGLAMFNGTVTGPSGPSAIVNYVDTELPSVMIIETQKQKHTIIWFSET